MAKSIHRIFPNYTIIGYDVNTATLKEAQEDGTLDHYTTNISDIANCDYIFLCAPVHYNIEYLKTLKPLISDSCILSDVGSVKSDIYDAVKERDLVLILSAVIQWSDPSAPATMQQPTV